MAGAPMRRSIIALPADFLRPGGTLTIAGRSEDEKKLPDKNLLSWSV